jgi:hypothetical protein
MKNLTAPRPAFVEAHPAQKEQHLAAQRAFFGAARTANLNWDRDDQLEGINAALGLRGGKRIMSRREVTPTEYRALVVAIEAGLFSRDWTWGHEFTVSVHTREVTEVHFEPRLSSPVPSVSVWMTA